MVRTQMASRTIPKGEFFNRQHKLPTTKVIYQITYQYLQSNLPITYPKEPWECGGLLAVRDRFTITDEVRRVSFEQGVTNEKFWRRQSMTLDSAKDRLFDKVQEEFLKSYKVGICSYCNKRTATCG